MQRYVTKFFTRCAHDRGQRCLCAPTATTNIDGDTDRSDLGDTLCYVVGKILRPKSQPSGRGAARRELFDQEMFVGTIQIFRPCSLPVSDIPCSFGKYIIRLTCTRTLHSRKAHHFQGKSQNRIFSSRAARAPKICVTA